MPPLTIPPSRLRLLVPTVLFALAPKCLMCLAGYVAVAAGLRFGGPEVCGASASNARNWLTWLTALGLAAGVVIYLACGRRGTGLPTRDG